MIVLNTLYELTSELSLANDNISHDPNIVPLIISLIEIADKFLIPDISVLSLQCINSLLDINPAFNTYLKKYGGLSKIVYMTQNIEFIDQAEQAIKAIEKISGYNAFALLEFETFSSILNILEFFEFRTKKSCFNSAIVCLR